MALDIGRRQFIAGLSGATLVWPLAARAQQAALPVIGFLTAVTENFVARERIAAFRAGLAEKGFVEGKNVAIEYRYADTHLERLPALAMDLVRRKVSVIFATGGDVPALIAKGATSTIPIVFGVGDDPVQAGLVSSLNRPGGMVTGATVIAAELAPKRLELLRELIPTARRVAVLMNEDNPSAEIDTAATLAAARRLGCEIVILKAGTEDEVDKAFVRLADVKGDGLVVNPDPLFLNMRTSMVARVGRQNVPAI